MLRRAPQHDGPIPDAPSGHGHRFERDREWLVFREQGGRSIAFSKLEVRVHRSFGPFGFNRYRPIEQCRRLRVLDPYRPRAGVEGDASPIEDCRLAFDAAERTVLFGRGLSDSETRSVFRYLIATVPRFAESHERS